MYIIVSSSKSQYIFTTMSFHEGPHQKLFFHLQENEHEMRARLDEKNIGNDLTRFLMGTICRVIFHLRKTSFIHKTLKLILSVSATPSHLSTCYSIL